MPRPLVALLVALPLLAAGTATAAPKDCRKSCTTLRSNCLGFARAALGVARESCTGARAGRRAAARTCRGERSTCAKARAACRPCCKLGGVNECARQAGRMLQREPQVEGDPVVGRELLLGGDYMTCGIPYKVWS